MKNSVTNSCFRKAVVLGAFAATFGTAALASTPALTVFDFANLKNSGTTFSGFLPTDGIFCTSGDLCSSDIASSLSGDLTFVKNNITVHALASYNGSAYGVGAAVVQDHDNNYNGADGLKLSGSDVIGAGLGVYHLKNINSDDNITAKESIKLHFDSVVTLSAIALRSEGHNTTSWTEQSTFQYSFDNSSWTTALLPRRNGVVALNQTGQDFYFRFAAEKGNQFYLSAMSVTAVPEPETFALLLAGMGLVGFAARRRKSAAA